MDLKNKINLSLVLFLLSGVLFLIFLIRPVYNNIQESFQGLISHRQELASLENKIEDIKEFKKNYQGIKESLERISTLFAKPEAPVNFISFLEEISQKSQITINISSSLSKKEGADIWPSITFQVNSTAPFSNFSRFLEKLESGPYLLEINNLNITRLEKKDLNPKQLEDYLSGYIRASLSIKVFTD